MRKTDRIALKLRAEKNCSHSGCKLVCKAKKERGAARERKIEGAVLRYEALSRIP